MFSKLSKSEREELSDIYVRLKNKCMAVALNIVKETALAEDAVHSAFAGLLENKETFFALAAYKKDVYIVVSVRNKAIDIARNKKIITIQPQDDTLADIEFDVGKHHESKEGYNNLVTMIESIPEKYQTVFERYISIGAYKNKEVIT